LQTEVLRKTAVADENSAALPRPVTRDVCEKWVEQLASKTEPPFDEGEDGYVLRLPRGITESGLIKAQLPVREAFNSLSENLDVALPIVVKHIDDKRFSYVQEEPSNGVYFQVSVGSACRKLLDQQIAVYKPNIRSIGGGKIAGEPPFAHKPEFVGSDEKWWETRKNKSLVELQLEAVEWAIAFEKKMGFESPAEEKKSLGPLEIQATQLRRTLQPIRVKPELYFFSK